MKCSSFVVFLLPICLTLPFVSCNKKLSKHSVILVVSFDGVRYDYLRRGITPALDNLRKSGVSVPYMTPAFPTFSLPSHQSISTGLFSETHGVVGNTFFDPKYNRTLQPYHKNDSNLFWNYSPEVLPIWIRNEMGGDGRISGCYFWPGCSSPYGGNNDKLPTYYIPEYDSSVTWDTRVDTVISWMTNDTAPANLVFLYHHMPDFPAQRFGPLGSETLKEISRTDNRTKYLVDKLKEEGIFDKINLIVLSDHGMAPLAANRVIYFRDVIDPSLLDTKYGETPVFHLVPKPGKGDQLYRSLKQNSMSGVGFEIWRKEEVREKYHYTDSRRITKYVLLAKPGYIFEDNLVYYKWNGTDDPREYGAHGYANDATELRTVFLAIGPAFKKGYEFPPIHTVDVVPLISKIIGIKEPPNNGSFDKVVEMIRPEISSKPEVDLCHGSLKAETVLPYIGSRRHYFVNPEIKNVEYTPKGCEPVKRWYFGRHGTRYPWLKHVQRMRAVLPRLQKELLKVNGNQSRLCNSTLEYLSSWEIPGDLNASNEYRLHKQGYNELYSIGSRLRSRFPQLFKENGSSSVQFGFANTHRAEFSAKSFASAIFSKKLVWNGTTAKVDPLADFYENCPKWLNGVNYNLEALGEMAKFNTSPVMHKTIERVSKMLGLQRNLSFSDLDLVYFTCAYETAWTNERVISPWCALFDLEAFQVFGYRLDLEYYYRDGYGHANNYLQGCLPLKDLVQFFDDRTPLEKVKAYFGHSRGFLKVISRLGLYKDKEHLQSDNYDGVKDHFLWRTGFIDPMASHMIFVLYKCNHDTDRIGFFTNEMPTPLPACGNEAFCSFGQLRHALEEFIQDCDFENMCKTE